MYQSSSNKGIFRRREKKMRLVAVKLSLLCCLLEGSRCQDWAAVMPSSVAGLGGSCIRIPCRFTIDVRFNNFLDDTCSAVWRRGRSRTVVFDSSLTGESTSLNLLQGNLTGSLKDQDCTTTLHNVLAEDSNSYYFRVDCDNALKFNFANSVELYIQDSPPMPAVTADRPEVEEGDPLTLECSTPAPCPALPPALTWMPALGFLRETREESRVTSAMELRASHLHNMVKVTCTALHRREGGRGDLGADNSLTLHVVYAPKNTSVSYEGPVTEGRSVTLTCTTDANPAANTYAWFRVQQAEVTSVGVRQQLSTTVSEDANTFYCTVRNRYGSQNSSVTLIDVLFPPKETTVIVEPAGLITEGDSVVLLCQSRARPPVSDYMWFKDGQQDGETGSVLFVERAQARHGGDYRCKASNTLGEQISAAVRVDVQYPPRNTSATVRPSGPVPDGSTVTLMCASVANPVEVDITWYRVAARVREVIGRGQEVSFNVSRLSKDRFHCEAANVHGMDASQPVSINVTFRPEILASSRCKDASSQRRCSCDSRANPPPSLHWELSGAPVNHSSVTEVALGDVTRRSVLTLQLSDQDQDLLSLVCFSVNPLGVDSLAFNMSSTCVAKGRYSQSVLVGSSVGVSGMLILSLLLLFYVCRKTKGAGQADNTYLVANEQSNSAHVNGVDTNHVSPVEEGQLHYADVSFAKLQAKSLGESEIRGLSSMTGEYAEIRLRSMGSDGGAGEEADAHLGQGEDGGTASEEVPTSPE